MASRPTDIDEELDALEPWPSDARMELRWAVDVGTWRPRLTEWHFLLSMLPASEAEAVRRLPHPVDRRRGLVSRLLQRRGTAVARRLPDESIVIGRTKGNKPFDATPRTPDESPHNFNFNVSHEGHFVVLASDPALLIGVDVSAPFHLRSGPSLGDFDAVRKTFANILTLEEWDLVEACESEALRLGAFRRAWTRKESFTKACGEGLAFELQRVEFCPCRFPQPADRSEATGGGLGGVSVDDSMVAPGDKSPSSLGMQGLSISPSSLGIQGLSISPSSLGIQGLSISPSSLGMESTAVVPTPHAGHAELTADGERVGDEEASLQGRPLPTLGDPAWALVHLDGYPKATWRCRSDELTAAHLVSVTRGPVTEAVDEHGDFKRTFARPAMPAGEIRARLATPAPSWRLLSVRDLVPPSQRKAYDDVFVRHVRELPPRPRYQPAEPPQDASAPSERHAEIADHRGGQVPPWFNSANASSPAIHDPLFGGDPFSGGRSTSSGGAVQGDDGCKIS